MQVVIINNCRQIFWSTRPWPSIKSNTWNQLSYQVIRYLIILEVSFISLNWVDMRISVNWNLIQSCNSIKTIKLLLYFSLIKYNLKHDMCYYYIVIGIYAYVVMKGDLQKYVKAIEGEG